MNSNNTKDVQYCLESDSSYRIDNFDQALPFSSFLPGIGGPDGIPLWCMYVNRGQGVVSFGVANKDNAISEFLSATWAYQLANVQGFRTFCKIDGKFYEPFQNDLASSSMDITRSMWISSDRLRIYELNRTLEVCFEVEYFSPVNRTAASLVRSVKIINVFGKEKHISGLDGLPLIIPAGITDYGLKHMRHLTEAYVSVKLAGGTVPFYSAKVVAHDEAEVEKVAKGNFYAAWSVEDDKLDVIEPFVDPHVIFGAGNGLATPLKFISSESQDRSAQVWENRLPCALAPFEKTLSVGQSIKLVAIAGHAADENTMEKFLGGFKTLSDIKDASDESVHLIDSVTSPAFAVSNVPVMDAYARQNYLDNVLRGGVPKLMPSASSEFPLYLYSRRHGDLERDYNFFQLQPHPLSTGAGNYRDVCQNSRYNIWYYPELFDHEIRMFTSLLQADGYNPLGIEGYRWQLPQDADASKLCPALGGKGLDEFCKILKSKFHPGELLNWANSNEIEIQNRDKWLDGILCHCDCSLVASGCEGGYWIDHWTYIADSLEAFAGLYPDRVKEMLTSRADIDWYNEGAYVVPRKDKYVQRASGPLQLNSVIETDISKISLLPVTVLGKLCAILAIKAVSLDYAGRGIEMEAGRPGWNDSMNGMPGLFGSSTCETAETARLARWLIDSLDEMPDTVFPVEVADFILEVACDVASCQYVWSRAAKIREEYRSRIRTDVSGTTGRVSGEMLCSMLKGVEKRMQDAISKSIDAKNALVDTYYSGTPIDAKPQMNGDGGPRIEKDSGMPYLQIDKFEYEPLPLFLEGQVHLLRILKDSVKAREIYNSVRNSDLFDRKLEMYKLNECLGSCPDEIGRARTFSRGWFENESVWTHMSYKYLLELLRSGLVEEFFCDAKTMLVPFMNPGVYGRSVLENSSFISSSACPDPNAHGRGFIARLSGSTAEFIHIWLLLTVGGKPFFMVDGKLNFQLKPILPGNWFTTEKKTINFNGQITEIDHDCFACTLLGDILLVYHNPSRKDTYGHDPASITHYVLDDVPCISSSHLNTEQADNIRQRKYSRIDVWLE